MKSYDGCWTCRLRKKRCDETKPACRNCSILEITCHFGADKPLWMDNGIGQREKAEEVKRKVKSAAARRRGARSYDILEPIAVEPVRNSETPTTSSNTLASAEATPRRDSWVDLDRWFSDSLPSEGQFEETELERRFVMMYLDHFFPFLFPFYKPQLLEGGRSWVMELIASDQAMWHTTLCLSSYFVSITMDGAVSGPNVCKTSAWEKLLEQIGVTFMMIQRNIQQMGSANTQAVLVKRARIMGSIIQLQRFETSIGNFENCHRHLGAANSLFKDIIDAAGKTTDGGEQLDFTGVLSLMGRPLWATMSRHSGAWNSDQAAFRFYSALLVVDDVVGGVCTGKAPELLQYHTNLLTNGGDAHGKPPLCLEEFIGCENWVIIRIGEIGALDAWKRSTQKAGRLDMMELVSRASAIQQTLLGNLASLDTTSNTSQSKWLGLFSVYNDQLPPMPGGCTMFVTRVWAHAALIYLAITISGWQPGSAGIRENVTRILALLERMPTPELLRTVVWPYCIVGCLCEPAEESRLRAMAQTLVPHRLFGPARKALDIMENVWNNRDALTVDTDFATCVSSLGCASLLV